MKGDVKECSETKRKSRSYYETTTCHIAEDVGIQIFG